MYRTTPPLVIFHKQLGDTLLMEPALAKLSAAFGGSVQFSTRAAFLPLVELMNGVIGLHSLRMVRASQVMSFSGNIHAAIKTLIVRSPRKLLYLESEQHVKKWHRLIYTDGISTLACGTLYRALYYYGLMPDAEGISFRPPRLKTPPAAWRPSLLPGDYILLHPTAAWRSKSWPAEKWTGVLAGLESAGLGPFVITGGAASWEQECATQIASKSGAKVLNLAGSTTLKQYLSVVANARMVLCVDGSSSHLAAAFGRPCVTLFGSTSETNWHWPSEISVALTPPPEKRETRGSAAFIPVDSVLTEALAKYRFSQRVV